MKADDGSLTPAAKDIDVHLREISPQRREHWARRAMQEAGLDPLSTARHLQPWLKRLSREPPESILAFWPVEQSPAGIGRLAESVKQLLCLRSAMSICRLLYRCPWCDRPDLLGDALIDVRPILDLAGVKPEVADWIGEVQNGHVPTVKPIARTIGFFRLRELQKSLDRHLKARQRQQKAFVPVPNVEDVASVTRRTVEGRFGPLDASGWGEDLAKALRRIPSRDIEMVLMKIDGVKLGKIGARVGLSKSRACERIASTLLRLREMLGGSGGAIV